MVQLYVYDDTGSRFEVDLYKSEPIKITLSAENLGSLPTVDSAFSRQFRIPANQHNSKVFQWWYEVNIVDFDVRKKIKSEIHVDGLLYKTGHTRINAAYVNQDTSQIDLELIFYGETRDFSTQVGDGFLPLLDLSTLAHKLTTDNIQKSWLPLTDPNVLVGGGIRYILADRGYTYTQLGNEFISDQSEIAFRNTGDYRKSFQQNARPITLGQFTPMIQVKAIIDAIFAQTDYTYSSDSIFTEDWFKDLYTDGLPEGLPETPQTNADFTVRPFGNIQVQGLGEQRVPFGVILENNAGAYSVAGYQFNAVESDTLTFDVDIEYGLPRIVPLISPTVITRLYKNNTVIRTETFQTPNGITPYIHNEIFSQAVTVVPGDKVYVTMQFLQIAAPPSLFATSRFSLSGSSLTISANNLLKRDVKSIDFLKSILTKFKLIMAPSLTSEQQFVIKPYKDYIGSGDRLDWTTKMDVSKDAVLQPVFYDQSQRINFVDTPDTDIMNVLHTTTFDRVFGQLFFDSENELLTNTETVKTIFAPTPVNQINGSVPTSDFIIPFFTSPGEKIADHGNLIDEPMTPKPRLLFWNGLISQGVMEDWYYEGANDLGVITKIHNTVDYPRMSYLTEIPSLNTSLNLNWFREQGWFRLSGGPEGNLGESVYERFWNTYIQSLYSPLARKLTAYFTLDSQDLRKVSFDDLIFIQNAWWRVLKIYDAPLTDISTVKVDLIKILDEEIFANSATPTDTGAGIDDVVVTGGGGSVTGTSVPRIYAVQNCINPGDFIYAYYQSINALLPGDSVQLSGIIHAGECYTIVAQAAVSPTTAIIAVFPDCLSCAE